MHVRIARRFLLGALSLTACHGNGAPSIRRTVDNSGRSVFVAGPVANLQPAGSTSQPPQEERLQLFVADSDRARSDLPPVAGDVTRVDDTLRFRPAFPLQLGGRYRAVLKNPSGTPVVELFTLPPPAARPPTVVVQVYPSTSVLPENLLKFYVHFSAPMRQDEAYQKVRLLRTDGSAVELPFVEFRYELWDPDGKRLTLLIDPGRIKREVKPLEDIGPALRAEHEYTLVVDPAWRDAAGSSLATTYRKKFQVTAADRSSPTPHTWQLNVPESGSSDPLTVDFGEPLDHGLLATHLWAVDSDGDVLLGAPSIGSEERSWTFTPSTPWSPGRYKLLVSPVLEDLAGNSVGRPFEVDLGTASRERQAALARVPFDVR